VAGVAWPLHCTSRVVKRASRGFTLIEMMIVVVIIGVLAVLAVVGYRKLITSSHVSEATNMVQNIRVAQEGYHAETQQYAGISASIAGPWYPSPTPNGRLATAWGATCTVCNIGMDWSYLPLHVDGPVLFGYATTAGAANTGPTDKSILVNGQVMSFPQPSATDWFIVAAMCDLDGDGQAPDTHVYTTSWTNQVFVDSEGQ
jgi:type IV pilus assembly protein PilA